MNTGGPIMGAGRQYGNSQMSYQPTGGIGMGRPSMSACQYCGRINHSSEQCRKKGQGGLTPGQPSSGRMGCAYCGRTNHTSDQCRKKEEGLATPCMHCGRTNHSSEQCRRKVTR